MDSNELNVGEVFWSKLEDGSIQMRFTKIPNNTTIIFNPEEWKSILDQTSKGSHDKKVSSEDVTVVNQDEDMHGAHSRKRR